MKDYSDLGLNDKLQSVNSLTNRPITSIYDLDAITANKSKIASLNSLSGGTLILGGTNSGDGVLSVNNSAGSNVVTLNNTGLTVNNGSITVQNSGGTAIIDSGGLVSTANFRFESISGTVPALLGSSTVLEDISNGSITFNIARNNTQVLCIYGAHLNHSADWVEVDLVHAASPGTAVGTILDYISGKGVTAGVFFSLTGHRVITLSSGTNKLSLRWMVGSGTATLDSRALSAIILGA